MPCQSGIHFRFAPEIEFALFAFGIGARPAAKPSSSLISRISQSIVSVTRWRHKFVAVELPDAGHEADQQGIVVQHLLEMRHHASVRHWCSGKSRRRHDRKARPAACCSWWWRPVAGYCGSAGAQKGAPQNFQQSERRGICLRRSAAHEDVEALADADGRHIQLDRFQRAAHVAIEEAVHSSARCSALRSGVLARHWSGRVAGDGSATVGVSRWVERPGWPSCVSSLGR